MKKDVTKEMILEFFDTVEDFSGASNAIEYFVLGGGVIRPTQVLEWLKLVGKYRECRYEDTPITDQNLAIYSFLDIENEFADEQFGDDYAPGYELAAEFLLSDACTEEQFKWYINKLVTPNSAEDADDSAKHKWYDEVKEEMADFLHLVNM